MLRALVLLIAAWLTVAVDARAASSQRAQLDRDVALETVRVEPGRCAPAARECSRLVVVDGGRRTALSTVQQAGQPANYRWTIRRLRVIDVTGDGIRDVIWEQHTAGGTGSSPIRFAAARWDGRRARALLSLAIARRPGAVYDVSIPFRLRVVPARDGLRELATTEGLYRPDDPTCCPSAIRRRRHRYDGRRLVPVRGSTVISRARAAAA